MSGTTAKDIPPMLQLIEQVPIERSEALGASSHGNESSTMTPLATQAPNSIPSPSQTGNALLRA